MNIGVAKAEPRGVWNIPITGLEALLSVTDDPRYIPSVEGPVQPVCWLLGAICNLGALGDTA